MKTKFDFKKLLNNKNNSKIIIIFAFVGIALIALSEFIPEKTEVEELEEEAEEDYSEYLELKIKDIIKAITGEDEPVVMLTLSGSSEYVYVTENSEKIIESETTSQKESEETYIIIENSDGEQEALLVKVLQPEITGVVIATQYAQNATVKESIINAVTTVLDLPSNKVCVVNKTN